MSTIYQSFIEAKTPASKSHGFAIKNERLNPMLFDFQRDIVKWALRKGRAAIFADCGLGKTPMQLEWAKHIPGKVLILAPLAVGTQTAREGSKFHVGITYSRHPIESMAVTNYEMLEHFNPCDYTGIVLDESSILKSYDGQFRTQVSEAFAQTPYRLACTATPAPNDYMELGNHAEFLGVVTRTEMLSTFFVHDGGDTSKWRLKRHAQNDFWKWVCSWAVMIHKPSDLGYEDDGFILPPLHFHEVTVDAQGSTDGRLFHMPAATLDERRKARQSSVTERAAAVANIVAQKPNEPWLIWCNLNSESDAAVRMIPGAVELRGADGRETKESRMLGFSAGDVRVLVTKPSIAGFGMNWQHCPNVVFLGLSDSYEQFYQAVRRCWRFGQKQEVHCHIVTAENEGAVTDNIKRKEKDAARMAAEMVVHMKETNTQEINGISARVSADYKPECADGEGWSMHLGDCVDVLSDMANDSVHYSIFSPPFASLYTYSASPRDMGNCRTHAEFYEHFKFITSELYRVLKPGRNLSFHCMNLPVNKQNFGYIGIADFRGDLIRLFQEVGFIYHSEVCIWKDPVTAMQRTKALGLLHKQLKKDSCMSRQGIPDYLVTMRKPGDNPERVEHTNRSFPVSQWQEWASPTWTDINPFDTLQRESAREEQDERHICPLQLEVIKRGLILWSNPNDIVLSPFAGIGSEGYVAIQQGRRFIGVELKESYYRQAVSNLRNAKDETLPLFAHSEVHDGTGISEESEEPVS